jgi:hypothetical protein
MRGARMAQPTITTMMTGTGTGIGIGMMGMGMMTTTMGM